MRQKVDHDTLLRKVFGMNKIYNFRWSLSWAFLSCFLFTLPFIVNNNYFIDDWLRSDTGNSGWEGNGRPFASILMSAISLFPHGRHFFGDNALFDVFPLTLILSSAVLVASGYIFCLAMKVDGKVQAFIICILPACNPFWVGNIEFRHDSLLMSASFFLAILGAYISSRGLKFCIIAAILLSVSLGLYQTSINAYISMCACVLLSAYLSDEGKLLKKSALSFFSLGAGYVIYSNIIMNSSGLSSYAVANSKMLGFNHGLFEGALNNFRSFASFFFETSPPIYITALSALLLVSITSVIIRSGLTLKSFFSFATLCICLVMTLGVLALFERPAIAARTMMPLCLLPMLCVSLCHGRFSIAASSASAALVMIAFSFSYIISSAINSVERNDRFIAMHIASLYAKESAGGRTQLYITGKPKFTRYADRIIKRLPMAKYMIISAFNNYRFKYSLMAQYGIESQAPKLDKARRYDYISRNGTPDYSDALVDSFRDGDTVIYKIK